jgi:hypothetical protein
MGYAGQPRARIQPLNGLLHLGRFDGGDETSGSGSAELNDDGTIEIAFAYTSATRAERITSSTVC